MTHEPDPTTEELRLSQLRRERREREAAERDDEEAAVHARRAERAAYLREKLEQRARAEREAGDP